MLRPKNQSELHMTASDNAVVIPAYVDEAGARGLVRDLDTSRDDEIGLMCAVLFEPDGHDKAIRAFTPSFEKFRDAAPQGAKLHITDAFKPGNESWRAVAERVREEYLSLINTVSRPMIIYSARRLRLSRQAHIGREALRASAKAARRSQIRIVGENRPSDVRIEDDLIECLTLRLDAFAEDMAEQVHVVQQVDLLFDEVDLQLAQRYEAVIQRTRQVSANIRTVKGWDPTQSKRLEGAIEFQVDAPFRIDTKFIGPIRVMGKDHPLILAADIVANHLAHHLRQLPPQAPLNAPSSIAGWAFEERVWGVQDDATDDVL